MKPITFMPQAPFKIAQRKLKLDWVERAARIPEWREVDPDDASVERRFLSINEADGRVIRVVVRETKSEICVISAFLDRGARRPHAAEHLRS